MLKNYNVKVINEGTIQSPLTTQELKDKLEKKGLYIEKKLDGVTLLDRRSKVIVSPEVNEEEKEKFKLNISKAGVCKGLVKSSIISDSVFGESRIIKEIWKFLTEIF